ncbi:MAG TPA: BON domain-containing protein [Chloroflexota bacterium]|nr:BON domain-containing protein [Chloroflexota bacterium]
METGEEAARPEEVWPPTEQPGPDEGPWVAWRPDVLRERPPRAADSAELAAARLRGPSGGVLWGLGLLMGMAAMYLLDAEHGEARRAGVARRVQQYRDEVERTLEREGERAWAQLRGTTHAALRGVRERLIPDATIRREIQARLEDVLPFEEAAQLHVAVQRGRVLLEGPIAPDRLNRLLGHVATVPGVRGLDNRLIVQAPGTRRGGQGGGAADPPRESAP